MNDLLSHPVIKNIIYSLPLFILIWKAIDKYFEYQAKKDKELIKELVREVMGETLTEIRNDIKELRQDREKDMREINNTLREIVRDMKK